MSLVGLLNATKLVVKTELYRTKPDNSQTQQLNWALSTTYSFDSHSQSWKVFFRQGMGTTQWTSSFSSYPFFYALQNMNNMNCESVRETLEYELRIVL